MSLGQEISDEMYTENSVMNNWLRNDFFGYIFGKSYD